MAVGPGSRAGVGSTPEGVSSDILVELLEVEMVPNDTTSWVPWTAKHGTILSLIKHSIPNGR